MRATDYGRIADVYDRNPIRSNYGADECISRIFSTTSGELSLLDLACGTGTYLLVQAGAFPDARMHWYGCDLSKDMLGIARTKLPGSVTLTLGDAARLPYPDEQFDFVSCNFAFQHFPDKPASVKEVRRVLKPGGIFHMRNICPEAMPSSWVYHFFRGTRGIDRERFWKRSRLRRTFTECGFSLHMETTISEKAFDMSTLIKEAENRDMSQLNLIPEKWYRSGLARMKREARARGTYSGSFALLWLRAEKQRRSG